MKLVNLLVGPLFTSAAGIVDAALSHAVAFVGFESVGRHSFGCWHLGESRAAQRLVRVFRTEDVGSSRCRRQTELHLAVLLE